MRDLGDLNKVASTMTSNYGTVGLTVEDAEVLLEALNLAIDLLEEREA